MCNAITDFLKFKEHYDVEVNWGTLWMLGPGNGAPEAIQVPNLLAIPNALINQLRMQGPAITPYDVMAMVDYFIQTRGHPLGQQWECVRKWCNMAGQTGTNSKARRS